MRADSLLYDGSGNVVFAWTRAVAPGAPRMREDRAMYYAADGRLRVVDHRTATENGPDGIFIPITFDFDEHRYDALGRRVLTRTQRECVIQLDFVVCGLSTIRRSIWDGEQEIMEIQQPGHTGASPAVLENDTAFAARLPIYRPGGVDADLNWFYGRVAYTFGGTLDQPLSVTRWAFQRDSAGQLAQWPEPFTIVPHWNVRGAADNGAFADGSTRNCNSTAQSYCLALQWSSGWTAYEQKFFQPRMWHGALLEEKRDGSGLVFKRNRYLDPGTGKFTQEDPIGLAGGLNLYGFASGDPVSYSDPFGLFACNREKPGECSLRDAFRNFLAGLNAIWSGDFEDKGPGWKSGVGLGQIGVMLGVRAPVGQVGPAAGAATSAAVGAADLLMPAGSPIGVAGSKAAIRELTGGANEASTLFSQLTQGGTAVPGSYPGTLIRLPNGGTVGMRTVMSRSPNTAVTIDVNISGIPITKIKFNP